MALLDRLGVWALNYLSRLGRATSMWFTSVAHIPHGQDMHLVLNQLHHVGVRSVLIIVLSAFSIGAVIALQFHTQLSRFGAEDAVGLGLTLTLLRELGPVVTGLLFAGRAGSAITAEIGLMKTTEQLSSMEMMGVDPLYRIVAPRLWAGIISMPLLTIIFNVVGIFGGFIVAVQWLGSDPGGFWSGMQAGVELWNDIGKGLLKSLLFALVITWIAVFQGYDTEPTAEGVGLATTRTVVLSSVVVLAMDFFLTLIMYGDF
ncbi:MAG: ABC transporter permease [Gammaproteobacteria bacterium]|nr:ABC transporter permease [Gammaproteobacteria bacterium]